MLPKSNQKAARHGRYKIPWPEHKPGDFTVIRISHADGFAYARVLTDDDPDPLPSPPGNGWTLLEEDDDAG